MDGGDRYDRLDALRGFAIVWMAAFHFAFDLNHFGLLSPRQNFYADPLWTTQRTLHREPVPAGRRRGPGRGRGARAVVAEVLEALGPGGGVRRAGVPRLVVHVPAQLDQLRRAARHRAHAARAAGHRAARARVVRLLGLVAIALPHLVQHPFFDTRLTNWVGLVTRKPVTEDYVPLLPWLGVMGLGYAATREAAACAAALARPAHCRGALRPLALLGRWPLTFYMLHQPVLIGLVMAGRGE